MKTATKLRHAFLAFFLLALFPTPRASAAELADRWIYLQTNLQVEKNADDAETLFRRAAKAGYNGVLLADSKLAKLGDEIGRAHV